MNHVGELIMKRQTPASLEQVAQEINEINEDLMGYAARVGALPWAGPAPEGEPLESRKNEEEA